MRVQGRCLSLLVLAIGYFVGMMVVHEAGHAVAISKLGQGSVRVLVWPGYELFPDVGARIEGKWPDKSLAITQTVPPESAFRVSFSPFQRSLEAKRERALVQIMGVAATTLVSILSLLLMSLVRPIGWLKAAMVALALFHLDAFTYTVFPTFLNAPHFLLFGGSTSEPISALSSLGLSNVAAIALMLSLSLAQFLWLYYLLKVRVGGVLPHNKSNNYAPAAPDAASRAGF